MSSQLFWSPMGVPWVQAKPAPAVIGALTKRGRCCGDRFGEAEVRGCGAGEDRQGIESARAAAQRAPCALYLFLENVCLSPSSQLPSSFMGTPRSLLTGPAVSIRPP